MTAPEHSFAPQGVRFDRLEKLLEHMESGKLSVDRFNFACFREEHECGTMGCMGGELPAVFPGEWEQKVNGSAPHWDDSPSGFTTSAAEFFGISWGEAHALFYPGCQHFSRLPLERLEPEATREQVAANLRRFIELKRERIAAAQREREARR